MNLKNDSLARTTEGDAAWSSTTAPFTPEEEDAIVTLVVIVIGIIAAIVILFSMGLFIDCKLQKKESTRRRKLKLKMPPLARIGKTVADDSKSLATDMCPNGASETGFRTRDAIV